MGGLLYAGKHRKQGYDLLDYACSLISYVGLMTYLTW